MRDLGLVPHNSLFLKEAFLNRSINALNFHFVLQRFAETISRIFGPIFFVSDRIFDERNFFDLGRFVFITVSYPSFYDAGFASNRAQKNNDSGVSLVSWAVFVAWDVSGS